MMEYFIIKDKLTGDCVCDVDEAMGVCWSQDYSERVVFVRDKPTDKFLAKLGLFNSNYFEIIYVDEDGYDV